MRKITKKATAAVAGGVIVVAAAGVGYAAWTNVTDPATPVSGTVGSNGNTLTLSTWGDSAGTVAAALPTTPGTSKDVFVRAQNVTQAVQALTSLTGSLSAGVCSVGADVTANDFTVTQTVMDMSVAKVATETVGKFTIALNAASTDVCQGQAISFSVDGS